MYCILDQISTLEFKSVIIDSFTFLSQNSEWCYFGEKECILLFWCLFIKTALFERTTPVSNCCSENKEESNQSPMQFMASIPFM